jgi:hypothetical protein
VTKTYQLEKNVTLNSQLNIEFKGSQIFMEYLIHAASFDDDSTSFYLSFNRKETRKLFTYYKTDCLDELIDNLHQHFTTYISLKRFHEFFSKREINSLLSDCPLTDS